ncbi:nucleoporin [Klebsormidium nitens]|uniref:Nucleoporin n=1 Tax=Klebsormidium nitens TaxID=105231 RepID=A0A0U9HRY3_KLENI|nr:nucleoporin [Klebsormidium nitens]|eukprot:GAQ80729.1 nucleoporin [Klebsormidium nitens]
MLGTLASYQIASGCSGRRCWRLPPAMAAVEATLWQGSAHDEWLDVHVRGEGHQGGEGQGGAAEDAAASGAIAGGALLPSNWLVAWRIRSGSPRILEVQQAHIVEASSFCGVRLHFPAAVQDVDLKPTATGAVLVALFSAGILYSAPLPATPSGLALEQLSPTSLRRHNLAAPLGRLGGATSLAAAASHALIGTKAGTLLMCALPAEQDEVTELKEADRVLGRLWRGLVSGVPASSPICAVATLRLRGADVGAALHLDGSLRLWNLQTRDQLVRAPPLHIPEEAKGYAPSGLLSVDTSEGARRIAVGYRHPQELRQVVCLYEIEEHGWAATFVQSHTIEGHVSSLALTAAGLTLLAAPTPNVPARLEQRSWRQHTVDAPLSVVPASDYVHTRLLLGDDQEGAFEQVWAALEDVELPDVSAVFVDRLLSVGVFSAEALTRLLIARGVPPAHGRDVAETAQRLRQAAKVPSTADQATALRGWRSLAQSYATTWTDLHQPLGLATNSDGTFAAAVNSDSISVLRAPDKAETERPSTSTEVENASPSLARCLELVGAGLGSVAGEVLTELLLRGGNAQGALDAFLGLLEGGMSALDGDRQRHKHDRERILQLRQSVEQLGSGAGGWDGVLAQMRLLIAGLEAGPGQVADAVAGGRPGAGLAVGGGVRQAVAAQLRRAHHVLLLLGLVQRCGAQVGVPPPVLAAVQSELVPATWRLLSSLLLVHSLATIPAATLAAPSGVDFSQRLSTLQIGDSRGPPSLPPGTLSLADVTLAAQGWLPPLSSAVPPPAVLLQAVQSALGGLRWRGGRREPQSAVERAADLAVLLLQHNQHVALKVFLQRVLDVAASLPTDLGNAPGSGGTAAVWFLYGLCCLATTGADAAREQGAEDEAVAAFLKAGTSVGSPDALLASILRLFSPQLASTAATTFNASSSALHRVHYFELVLALLERYGHLAGALQCARAALQELAAAYPPAPPPSDAASDADPDGDLMLSGSELALSSSQAREVHAALLWGHVFDLALRLRRYGEAYAAIVSNPDAGSAGENLRRLVTVLCEAGDVDVLCGQQLAYGGKLEAVHHELLRKAETSDVGAQSNPYRVLFAFHTARHNWRHAAAAMHRYAQRVAQEAPVTAASVRVQAESVLAAVTALRLLPPDSAWLPAEDGIPGPSKRPRIEGEGAGRLRVTVGIPDLQQQHAVLLARLFLLQRPQESIRRRAESVAAVPEVVWLLLEAAAFDQALSLATVCLTGAPLRKELEAIFRSLAGACCRAQAQEDREHNPARSAAPRSVASSLDGFSPLLQERSAEDTTATAATLWRSLQAYLERYDTVEHNFAFRTLVADTVLSNSSWRRKALPPWLADLCKAGDPAALLRTLLEHGRLEEAAELALDILEKPKKQRTSSRAGFVASQQLGAVWVPHTLLGQLQQDLAQPGQPASRNRAKLQAALHRELQQHVAQVTSDTRTLHAAA